MNKQLENDTQEKQWNNYSLKKRIDVAKFDKGFNAHTFFEDYKTEIHNDTFMFPHENIRYTNTYLMKFATTPNLRKIVSPKFKSNDLKRQVLLTALKHSFLNGNITSETYNESKNDEKHINSFTPLRIKHNVMKYKRSESPYEDYKLQRHANELIKGKLRIFNLYKKSQEKIKTRNKSVSFKSAKRGINLPLKQGPQEPIIKETTNSNLKCKLNRSYE